MKYSSIFSFIISTGVLVMSSSLSEPPASLSQCLYQCKNVENLLKLIEYNCHLAMDIKEISDKCLTCAKYYGNQLSPDYMSVIEHCYSTVLPTDPLTDSIVAISKRAPQGTISVITSYVIPTVKTDQTIGAPTTTTSISCIPVTPHPDSPDMFDRMCEAYISDVNAKLLLYSGLSNECQWVRSFGDVIDYILSCVTHKRRSYQDLDPYFYQALSKCKIGTTMSAKTCNYVTEFTPASTALKCVPTGVVRNKLLCEKFCQGLMDLYSPEVPCTSVYNDLDVVQQCLYCGRYYTEYFSLVKLYAPRMSRRCKGFYSMPVPTCTKEPASFYTPQLKSTTDFCTNVCLFVEENLHLVQKEIINGNVVSCDWSAINTDALRNCAMCYTRYSRTFLRYLDTVVKARMECDLEAAYRHRTFHPALDYTSLEDGWHSMPHQYTGSCIDLNKMTPQYGLDACNVVNERYHRGADSETSTAEKCSNAMLNENFDICMVAKDYIPAVREYFNLNLRNVITVCWPSLDSRYPLCAGTVVFTYTLLPEETTSTTSTVTPTTLSSTVTTKKSTTKKSTTKQTSTEIEDGSTSSDEVGSSVEASSTKEVTTKKTTTKKSTTKKQTTSTTSTEIEDASASSDGSSAEASSTKETTTKKSTTKKQTTSNTSKPTTSVATESNSLSGLSTDVVDSATQSLVSSDESTEVSSAVETIKSIELSTNDKSSIVSSEIETSLAESSSKIIASSLSLSDTDLTVGSESYSKASSEVSSKISSEVSSEISSEVSSEALSEATSEASSEVFSEISSEVSTLSLETSSEISSDISSEVSISSSEVSSDIFSEASTLSSELSSEIFSEVSSVPSSKPSLASSSEPSSVVSFESSSEPSSEASSESAGTTASENSSNGPSFFSSSEEPTSTRISLPPSTFSTVASSESSESSSDSITGGILPKPFSTNSVLSVSSSDNGGILPKPFSTSSELSSVRDLISVIISTVFYTTWVSESSVPYSSSGSSPVETSSTPPVASCIPPPPVEQVCVEMCDSVSYALSSFFKSCGDSIQEQQQKDLEYCMACEKVFPSAVSSSVANIRLALEHCNIPPVSISVCEVLSSSSSSSSLESLSKTKSSSIPADEKCIQAPRSAAPCIEICLVVVEKLATAITSCVLENNVRNNIRYCLACAQVYPEVISTYNTKIDTFFEKCSNALEKPLVSVCSTESLSISQTQFSGSSKTSTTAPVISTIYVTTVISSDASPSPTESAMCVPPPASEQSCIEKCHTMTLHLSMSPRCSISESLWAEIGVCMICSNAYPEAVALSVANLKSLFLDCGISMRPFSVCSDMTTVTDLSTSTLQYTVSVEESSSSDTRIKTTLFVSITEGVSVSSYDSIDTKITTEDSLIVSSSSKRVSIITITETMGLSSSEESSSSSSKRISVITITEAPSAIKSDNMETSSPITATDDTIISDRSSILLSEDEIISSSSLEVSDGTELAFTSFSETEITKSEDQILSMTSSMSSSSAFSNSVFSDSQTSDVFITNSESVSDLISSLIVDSGIFLPGVGNSSMPQQSTISQDLSISIEEVSSIEGISSELSLSAEQTSSDEEEEGTSEQPSLLSTEESVEPSLLSTEENAESLLLSTAESAESSSGEATSTKEDSLSTSNEESVPNPTLETNTELPKESETNKEEDGDEISSSSLSGQQEEEEEENIEAGDNRINNEDLSNGSSEGLQQQDYDLGAGHVLASSGQQGTFSSNNKQQQQTEINNDDDDADDLININSGIPNSVNNNNKEEDTTRSIIIITTNEEKEDSTTIINTKGKSSLKASNTVKKSVEKQFQQQQQITSYKISLETGAQETNKRKSRTRKSEANSNKVNYLIKFYYYYYLFIIVLLFLLLLV